MPIDLSTAKTTLSNERFIIYGASGSGKTRWAATAPKPLFFSEQSEGGWLTICGMPEADFWQPGVMPVVEPIADRTDIAKLLTKYEPMIRKGEFQTLVIDSLTFYSDLVLATLPPAKDPRQTYQALANHIRYLMVEIHKLPVHVVWICLASGGEGVMGGPLLPGKSAMTAPARCNFRLFFRAIDMGGSKRFEIHTRRWAEYEASIRQLPEASSPVPTTTFKEFLKTMGYSTVNGTTL